jgi:cytochrome b
MTTILVINAISSLLAAAGIGGFLAREKRRVGRNAVVQPLYVARTRTPPLPRRR